PRSARSSPHSFLLQHPAPTAVYTLSLHDALPILDGGTLIGCTAISGSVGISGGNGSVIKDCTAAQSTSHGISVGYDSVVSGCTADRKSTRLNSSHVAISYAVFCLKKKKKRNQHNA